MLRQVAGGRNSRSRIWNARTFLKTAMLLAVAVWMFVPLRQVFQRDGNLGRRLVDVEVPTDFGENVDSGGASEVAAGNNSTSVVARERSFHEDDASSAVSHGDRAAGNDEQKSVERRERSFTDDDVSSAVGVDAPDRAAVPPINSTATNTPESPPLFNQIELFTNLTAAGRNGTVTTWNSTEKTSAVAGEEAVPK